ncbi:unnamed protein product [Arctia plantaginis]|uniref:Uncharacterized protein n=1 Tax=Arctia plantaginis TaxID=874455 RepID=A0A8S1B038_ARCPL|nr:unnamed protein product [Arctia plantaginis]
MVTNYILLAVCLLFIQIPGFLTKPHGFHGDEELWTKPVLDNDYNWPQMSTDPTPYDGNIQILGKQVSSSTVHQIVNDLLKWLEDNYYIRVNSNASRKKSPLFAYSYYDMNN